MNFSSITASLIIFFLVIANAAATRVVLVNAFSEPGQKWWQAAFIWMVPGIGAATVFALLRGSEPKPSGNYPVDTSITDDPCVGLSNAATDYFVDAHHE